MNRRDFLGCTLKVIIGALVAVFLPKVETTGMTVGGSVFHEPYRGKMLDAALFLTDGDTSVKLLPDSVFDGLSMMPGLDSHNLTYNGDEVIE
jgi:hypothetical protein